MASVHLKMNNVDLPDNRRKSDVIKEGLSACSQDGSNYTDENEMKMKGKWVKKKDCIMKMEMKEDKMRQNK